MNRNWEKNMFLCPSVLALFPYATLLIIRLSEIQVWSPAIEHIHFVQTLHILAR